VSREHMPNRPEQTGRAEKLSDAVGYKHFGSTYPPPVTFREQQIVKNSIYELSN